MFALWSGENLYVGQLMIYRYDYDSIMGVSESAQYARVILIATGAYVPGYLKHEQASSMYV